MKEKKAKKKVSVAVRIIRILGGVILVVLLAVAAMFGYLTITEYKPQDTEPAEILLDTKTNNLLKEGETYRVLSFNTGYAGLGEESDFFMDGGSSVMIGQEYVEKNLAGIQSILKENAPDFYLLQEVDRDSKRSFEVDQALVYTDELGKNASFVLNYFCNYVPYPVPTIGKVSSGLLTMSSASPIDASRIALPVPFSWPVRTANLKRALLVQHYTLEGTDRQLAVINLHLEAYDDGEGKAKQTKQLRELMLAEYEKGNYVIAGGDFNQTFPGAMDVFPIKDSSYWTPGTIEKEMMPEGWTLQYDTSSPTCRLLNAPAAGGNPQQYFVIDGFICSPNIRVESVKTLDYGFKYADHNPVLLTFSMEQD